MPTGKSKPKASHGGGKTASPQKEKAVTRKRAARPGSENHARGANGNKRQKTALANSAKSKGGAKRKRKANEKEEEEEESSEEESSGEESSGEESSEEESSEEDSEEGSSTGDEDSSDEGNTSSDEETSSEEDSSDDDAGNKSKGKNRSKNKDKGKEKGDRMGTSQKGNKADVSKGSGHRNKKISAGQKYIVKHSSHKVQVKRILLDDALRQGNMEGWSDARKRAFQRRETHPNAYYYRFNDPGEQQRGGKWSKEEHDLFMERRDQIGINGQWGIFAMKIPGRVGYQCSNYYRKLIQKKELTDPNYVLDAKGKVHFLKTKGGSKAKGTRCMQSEVQKHMLEVNKNMKQKLKEEKERGLKEGEKNLSDEKGQQESGGQMMTFSDGLYFHDFLLHK